MSSLQHKGRELAELRIAYRKLLVTKVFSDTQNTRNFYIPDTRQKTNVMIDDFILIERYLSEKEMMNLEHPLKTLNRNKFANRTSFVTLGREDYQKRINSLTSFMKKVKTQYPNKPKFPKNVLRYLRKREIYGK